MAESENIFSLKQLPKGGYTVKVEHFSGEAKACQVRIIRFGSVKTWSGSIRDDEEHTITNFTVN